MDAISIPVSRTRAFTRAVVWSVPMVLCGLITYLVYSHLHFVPSAISNRLQDYSIAFICLPLPILGAMSAVRMVRWSLLSVWPGTVAIHATESAMTFSLGPCGIKVYDAARMTIRYPFELSEDGEEDGGFEGYLPEEEQLRVLLPRITHPDSVKPLNELLLRFAAVEEADAAALLRFVLEQWRAVHIVQELATMNEP
ncbi:MAG: hypothetical protein HY287_00220 [Planctomycetes bacterium]|nr:hypothetical protein [Planctomycetota bacterium]MBI3832737.1 hypothetical protein [Planctomycetota bacterium]